MTDSIRKLSEYFSKFPGIGMRQSRRFVYHLLKQNEASLNEFVQTIKNLKKDVAVCAECQRFFDRENNAGVCKICSDRDRDNKVLLIVEKDVDLESIEKNELFNGKYFVLGGTVPILEKEPSKCVRAKELMVLVNKKGGELKEIILATSANPEGENTAEYVRKILEPLQKKHDFKVSALGRGLSTGTELEYSDPDTLKSALKNRG